MIRLTLVRHGQSTWNLAGRLQGQAMHVPLTDLGREQAATAAATLVGGRFDRLLSSDQCRTLQTAQIIGDALGLPVEECPLLREQGRGILEGKLLTELGEEPTPVGLDISEVRWGGGESVLDVIDRLHLLLDDLRARPETDVLAVSHGDTMCILLAMIDGRSHRDVDWTLTKNGGIVERVLH